MITAYSRVISKGGKKITVVHFTTTTHNSKLSPGFFRALTDAGEEED